MAIELPFPYEKSSSGRDGASNRRLRALLPKSLKKICVEKAFLEDYLHWLPIDEIGVPDYYPELGRGLKDLAVRNLIYQIHGGLFIHVYPGETGGRDYYIPIEPHTTVALDDIMPEVETRLLDWTEEIGMAETEEGKKEVLLRAVDSIVTTGVGVGKIQVTPRQLEAIRYVVTRDKAELSLLQPLLLDPYIEDISCSGAGSIFIEHKVFKSLQTTITFPEVEDVDRFVIWMSEWIKRPVTIRNPIVDATLPDGSRINIIYGTDSSRRGSNFTIRKFSETPVSVMEIIEWGTMDYMMAAYLSFVLEEGMNVFVVGATASGRTTTMNAITTFILPDKKIVSIEDTPELQVLHKNWVRELTGDGGPESKSNEVGMFDLLKVALRQRPDRIIIGEIRGEEGAIAFQAMQMGHGVMSTFDAPSVKELIQRLTGDPFNVPKAYIDNLDVVLIQSAVRAPGGGGMVRRILSVNEIVGYDAFTQRISFIEAFRWNPSRDNFDFPGNMNSYLLEEKVAIRRGIPSFKRKTIYTELRRRAGIFERLHKQRKVRKFHDVFKILAEAHRRGLL